MNRNKVFGLSLVTAMLLGSSAYAGKIITNAGDPQNPSSTWTKNYQYGFGGWNFDNVNVRIVSTSDYNTPTLGSFNTSTGYYTGMGEGMSFVSDIKDRSTGTIIANLHGKDWPVGEPSGVKIINGDAKVAHGKPENCIMNTSYLAGTYLSTVAPKPVICSSDFQTHKRFKIYMNPASIDGVANGSFGKAIDMVFNLEAGDTSTLRYQVLQKIDNYTGKRLDGYSVEVLDASGNKNAALTLSLGAGEGDGGSDIWEKDELANFSHGLWGPVDDHFPIPGFFDDLRAYYPVALAADKQSLSYVGDMQGGNYQALFGNWLPSTMAPMGLFYDTDGDPETDADLIAFYGDPFANGTEGWYRGKATGWAPMTEAEVDALLKDPRYKKEIVEDVLNLGINYIVNVGDNTKLGGKFIIRIRPHVSADQTTPPSGVTPTDPTDPGTDLPTDSDGNTASSGGGGCTSNPNGKSFDFMFLMMMALGMLYPFRRKFLR